MQFQIPAGLLPVLFLVRFFFFFYCIFTLWLVSVFQLREIFAETCS